MSDPVVVRNSASFVSQVSVGRHRFTIDEPGELGGTDAGPTPYDLLAAALGGCTVMTLHFYAKRENIPLAGAEARVTHGREHAKDCADCETSSGFIHRFRIELKLEGELSPEQRTKLVAIAGRCPVSKTLTSEIRVDEVVLSD